MLKTYLALMNSILTIVISYLHPGFMLVDFLMKGERCFSSAASLLTNGITVLVGLLTNVWSRSCPVPNDDGPVTWVRTQSSWTSVNVRLRTKVCSEMWGLSGNIGVFTAVSSVCGWNPSSRQASQVFPDFANRKILVWIRKISFKCNGILCALSMQQVKFRFIIQ